MISQLLHLVVHQVHQMVPSLGEARGGIIWRKHPSGKNNTDFFNTSGGVQYWTVPTDGTYQFGQRVLRCISERWWICC